MIMIRDLVRIDEQAEFRNDVQLSAYDKPQHNLALLRSYLFSNSAPKDKTSSMGLLEAMVSALLSSRHENRLVAIASYGHGKSHLALSLANYFSRPANSKEFSIVMEKLGNTIDNPALLQRYRQFKKNRGEFLVIRLRGDVAGSLREQFMAGLSKALQEHDVTRDLELPFWYQAAAKFLKGLKGEYLDQANDFLEKRSLDVPLLIQQVEQKKNVYDLCVELFRNLHGVSPNFGGEISLDKAVDWVVSKTCGNGQPLGGVVVLFDEFSLFVQKYAYKNTPGELQELLNGISNHPAQAIFLAFAQHDPLTTAETALKSGQGLDNLKKELTRLPKREGYFYIYSLLESVIDAYLTQPKDIWSTFLKKREVSASIARATDLTYDLFSHRYDRTLRWSFERYQETVGRGCFPLHPMTTALLCDLNFQDAASENSAPRTVLGFVLQELDRMADEPAITDHRLRWVLPIRLVDYFEERLGGDRYAVYDAARRAIGAGAPEEQKAVLKALFLQEMAEIDVRGSDQLDTLGEMAGLDSGLVKSILRTLREQRVIRYNPITKVSSFWNRVIQPDRLEEALQRVMSNQPQTWEFQRKIIQDQFHDIAIDLDWGESNDWAALETMMTFEFLEVETLRDLAQKFAVNSKGLVDGRRGCLVWLLARDEGDLDRFRENASKVLDDAFPGDAPFPMVLVLPSQPNPDLIELLRRRQALTDLPKSDISEIGQDVYNDELNHLNAQILEARKRFLGDLDNYLDVPRSEQDFIVPLVYRPSIRAKNLNKARKVLEEIYHLAYQNTPPEFFTQYRVSAQGANKLRDVVKMVSSVLLRNAIGPNMAAIRAKKPGDDLVEKYLKNKWQLLGTDDRIQEPGNSRVRKAWRLIDKTFKAGKDEVPVRDALIPLLNVPYGYDYNTLTLLFCAWFGFYAHDLRIFAQGGLTSNDTLSDWLTAKNPKDFITQLCFTQNVTLIRQDESEILREIRALIDRVNTEKFSQQEAHDALIKLNKFVSEPRGQYNVQEGARNALNNLDAALSVAEQYDQEARDIEKGIQKRVSISDLLSLMNRLGRLPHLGIVSSTAPSPEKLQTEIKTTLSQLVEMECSRYEVLQQITDLGLHEQVLKRTRQIISKAGLTDLVPRFDQALENLKARAGQIEAQKKEDAVRDAIRRMESDAPLKKLLDYREELETITGHSEATMRLRDARLQAIRVEIEKLEGAAATWLDDLNNIVSLADLDNFRERLLLASARYKETSLEKAIHIALDKCKQYRALYGQLKSLETHSFITPEEVNQAFHVLVQIEESVKGHVSQKQCEQIEKTRQAINTQTAEKAQQANKWLHQRMHDFETGVQPGKLLTQLKSPPAFLPASGQEILDQLLHKVQDQFDQDVVAQIEAQFLQIADRQTQVECVKRLQKIITAEKVGI